MKTPTRTLLASVLLCAPLIASAAPAHLTPEQAFDLYARVLLEDDAAATRTLKLRYFASLREALGTDRESVTTTADTVGALRQELIARSDAHADALALGKAVRAAVNQVMANDTHALADGDEVAFFPPVTGG